MATELDDLSEEARGFLVFCDELRLRGATHVRAAGFEATFADKPLDVVEPDSCAPESPTAERGKRREERAREDAMAAKDYAYLGIAMRAEHSVSPAVVHRDAFARAMAARDLSVLTAEERALLTADEIRDIEDEGCVP